MISEYEIFKDISLRRKSTRKFSDKVVSDEDITKIIDIAKSSPYASGQKNWDIQIIKDRETIKNIADCVKQKVLEMESTIREDFRDPFLSYTKNFTFFEQAPAVFVLTFRISPIITHMVGKNITKDMAEWERDNYTKSISCVAMLTLLAAESLGLGACYMTGPIIAQDKIIPLIKAKPGREIGAIIPIGYKL
jgi:nitroreductase